MSKEKIDYCEKYKEWLENGKVKVEECDKEEECKSCEYCVGKWIEE